MRIGEISHNGTELWARCPFCGDSQNNLEKAHFAINLQKWIFGCLRCKVGGKLTERQILDLINHTSSSIAFSRKLTSSTRYEDLLPFLSHGAGNQRRSLLPRYHLTYKQKDLDIFFIRDPKDGSEIGLYARGVQKYSHIFGESGYSWNYDGPLLSTPSRPLRLVEGPYDVLYPQDVCCYGMISESTLKPLQGHSLILTPDGDIWEDEEKKKNFMSTLYSCLFGKYSSIINLVAIEYLGDGLDPDQVKLEDRVVVSRSQLQKRLLLAKKKQQQRRSYYASQTYYHSC